MHLDLRRCAVMIALLCGLSPISFSKPIKSCSNATLEGSYGFTFRGTNLDLKVDFIMMGRFEADGKGIFTGTESQSVHGKVGRGPFTGTYSVNPDCTGSANMKFQGAKWEAKMDFVLVSDGNEICILDVGGGTVEFGEAKRQFRKK
jgi:hypothetical protein